VIGAECDLHRFIMSKGEERETVERRPPMKLACASGSFHREIERGELTQLEFLDLCARELACDGVVLDVRHFPRTDDDYLAQVKKMATDRGLTIAALADSGFFSATPERVREALAQAVTLGAPIVAAPLANETECSWSDQLARLGIATALAKESNVTLALRNAPGTFAATSHDCKRVAKESDSAWLRFGPAPLELDAASDPAVLSPNAVLLWSDAAAQDDGIPSRTLGTFPQFRGYLAFDDAAGAATAAQIKAALRAWRKEILNRI
jgi:hypothetical protein